MHGHAVELGLGGDEAVVLLARADQLAREDADVLLGLLCLRGVALRPPVGLDYQRFGFVLGELHVGDVAVEFACVLSD